MSVEIFDGHDSAHNDEAYLGWVADHPEGYIVNTNATINPAYMVLHRCWCEDVTDKQRYEIGAYTQRHYAKVCAESQEELREWVKKYGRPDGSFTGRECRCLRRTQ